MAALTSEEITPVNLPSVIAYVVNALGRNKRLRGKGLAKRDIAFEVISTALSYDATRSDLLMDEESLRCTIEAVYVVLRDGWQRGWLRRLCCWC